MAIAVELEMDGFARVMLCSQHTICVQWYTCRVHSVAHMLHISWSHTNQIQYWTKRPRRKPLLDRPKCTTISCSCLYFKSDSNNFCAWITSYFILRWALARLRNWANKRTRKCYGNLLLSTKFMLINCHILSDISLPFWIILEREKNMVKNVRVVSYFRFSINKLTENDHFFVSVCI